MKLLAICLGQAQKVPGKTYKSGIDKQPVTYPVHLDKNGLLGDSICNRKYHGGPEQAVYLEGSETLSWWAKELDRDLAPGTFGENLVIEGLDNRDVCVGDRFALEGGVVLEATSPRVPCSTFTAHMNNPRMAKLYTQAQRPGIYCRVIQTGMLNAGEGVRLIPYEGERVAIADLMIFQPKQMEPQQRARYLSTPLRKDLLAQLQQAD